MSKEINFSFQSITDAETFVENSGAAEFEWHEGASNEGFAEFLWQNFDGVDTSDYDDELRGYIRETGGNLRDYGLRDSTTPSLAAWKEEFQKLTTEYISGVDWDTVIFEDGIIEQAGDDLQLDAYRNIYNGEDSNPSIDEWEHYGESCDDREDFQILLIDKWRDVLAVRNQD